jgi:hypothetical protein
VIALLVAAALLVTVVLPSEYGIDPTRAGRLLGLTEMGEIKTQLASEAAADRKAAEDAVKQTLSNPGAPVPEAANAELMTRLDAINLRLDAVVAMLSRQQQAGPNAVFGAPIGNGSLPATTPEQMEEAAPAAGEVASVPIPSAPPASKWTDEFSIVLAPGEGVELKLVMDANAEAEFEWNANGAVLNFDAHGDGSGQSISYEKGRNVAEDQGVLRAAFGGNHGWFFRNRTSSDVTLTLRTRGNYSEFKRTV